MAQVSNCKGSRVLHGRLHRCVMWLGYPQLRESDIKAKIEGYTLVSNEQAHQQFNLRNLRSIDVPRVWL